MNKKKAFFFDRDGVINKIVYHKDLGILDSPNNENEFELIDGIGEIIRCLKRKGFLIIIVSNQISPNIPYPIIVL